MPSTVVDVSGGELQIVRLGPLDEAQPLADLGLDTLERQAALALLEALVVELSDPRSIGSCIDRAIEMTGGRIDGLFLRELSTGCWEVMLNGASGCNAPRKPTRTSS